MLEIELINGKNFKAFYYGVNFKDGTIEFFNENDIKIYICYSEDVKKIIKKTANSVEVIFER